MGPRLFKRGNPGSRRATEADVLSFNGATPLQAWKPTPEHITAEPDLDASMGPRLFKRGNSARSNINYQ